jgi:zinc and cadmium transporter
MSGRTGDLSLGTAMWPAFLITAYCVLIVLASLLGGWLPSWVRLTHTRMQLTMSFVGGLMLAVALLHLLPHAAVEAGSMDYAAGSAVLGLLAMFFTIRLFHVHGHEPHEEALQRDAGCDPAQGSAHQHVHGPGDACPSADGIGSSSDGGPRLGLAWVGLFTGLALHTLIDGVALAASVAVRSHDEAALGLIGAGTFAAVVLHKPLDALSITSIMLVGGWSARVRHLVNLVFSLMCPLGALAFYFGVQSLGDRAGLVVGCALGFAAGAFLCISLADLLPEVQFHRHDLLKLSAALMLGVLLAWGIGFLEPEHAHEGPDHHEHPEASASHGAQEHDSG